MCYEYLTWDTVSLYHELSVHISIRCFRFRGGFRGGDWRGRGGFRGGGGGGGGFRGGERGRFGGRRRGGFSRGSPAGRFYIPEEDSEVLQK